MPVNSETSSGEILWSMAAPSANPLFGRDAPTGTLFLCDFFVYKESPFSEKETRRIDMQTDA